MDNLYKLIHKNFTNLGVYELLFDNRLMYKYITKNKMLKLRVYELLGCLKFRAFTGCSKCIQVHISVRWYNIK
jgi:hypothetical protein